MARPADRGDQFPSDTGDAAPLNPATNLVQRDFDPTIEQKKLGIAAYQKVYSAGLPLTNPNVPAQQAWAGLIQEYLGFDGTRHTYQVFRHDGKSIVADFVGHEHIPQFDPDQNVVITRNLQENTYVIQGTPESDVKANWIELTEALAARPTANFGGVSIAQGYLWYYNGTIFETQNTLGYVINATEDSWEADEFVQVRNITEINDDSNVIWEPVQSKSVIEHGVALVTSAISAASYNKITSTLTYGSGTMRLFEKATASTDTLSSTYETVYTSVEESTPVDKIIHWKTINGRKMLVLEPCQASDV